MFMREDLWTHVVSNFPYRCSQLSLFQIKKKNAAVLIWKHSHWIACWHQCRHLWYGDLELHADICVSICGMETLQSLKWFLTRDCGILRHWSIPVRMLCFLATVEGGKVLLPTSNTLCLFQPLMDKWCLQLLLRTATVALPCPLKVPWPATPRSEQHALLWADRLMGRSRAADQQFSVQLIPPAPKLLLEPVEGAMGADGSSHGGVRPGGEALAALAPSSTDQGQGEGRW